VLLGLARGSGIRSLSGMAPIAGRYRRPLLGLPRAVVQAAALAAAQEDPRLTPWDDPHNVDGQFARVRVRGEVLPVLEESLGPGIAAALARTAQLARQDADALDQWADQVWAALQTPPGPAPGPSAPKRPNDRPEGAPGHDPCGLPGLDSRERARIMIGADAAPLPAGTPIAVVSRVVRRFLIGAGCPAQDLTAEHVARVVGLLCADAPSRAEVALPGGIRARREEGALVVRA